MSFAEKLRKLLDENQCGEAVINLNNQDSLTVSVYRPPHSGMVKTQNFPDESNAAGP